MLDEFSVRDIVLCGHFVLDQLSLDEDAQVTPRSGPAPRRRRVKPGGRRRRRWIDSPRTVRAARRTTRVSVDCAGGGSHAGAGPLLRELAAARPLRRPLRRAPAAEGARAGDGRRGAAALSSDVPHRRCRPPPAAPPSLSATPPSTSQPQARFLRHRAGPACRGQRRGTLRPCGGCSATLSPRWPRASR